MPLKFQYLYTYSCIYVHKFMQTVLIQLDIQLSYKMHCTTCILKWRTQRSVFQTSQCTGTVLQFFKKWLDLFWKCNFLVAVIYVQVSPMQVTACSRLLVKALNFMVINQLHDNLWNRAKKVLQEQRNSQCNHSSLGCKLEFSSTERIRDESGGC